MEREKQIEIVKEYCDNIRNDIILLIKKEYIPEYWNEEFLIYFTFQQFLKNRVKMPKRKRVYYKDLKKICR